MSIEDTIGYQDPDEFCIVCGKNVTHGGGFSRINHEGTKVNLCCPLCLETFERDPAPHLAKLARILEQRALRGINKPDQQG